MKADDTLWDMRELNRRLTLLLEDPHPGLMTWNMCLAEVLGKLAEYVKPKEGVTK